MNVFPFFKISIAIKTILVFTEFDYLRKANFRLKSYFTTFSYESFAFSQKYCAIDTIEIDLTEKK